MRGLAQGWMASFLQVDFKQHTLALVILDSESCLPETTEEIDLGPFRHPLLF
jgi:hypothetical protein